MNLIFQRNITERRSYSSNTEYVKTDPGWRRTQFKIQVRQAKFSFNFHDSAYYQQKNIKVNLYKLINVNMFLKLRTVNV